VRGIHQQSPAILQRPEVDAAGPLGVGQRRAPRSVWNRKALPVDRRKQSQRDRGVDPLMFTAERDGFAGNVRERRLNHGSSSSASHLGYCRERLGGQRSHHHRHARFDDARLFERDFPQRRPKIQLMVERD
jgi:hypothetical protein